MKPGFIVALGMLLFVGSVFAVDPIQIAAENCGFDMVAGSEWMCTMDAVYSCDITDNTGATQIRSVIYTIGGVDYEAIRSGSGTVLNDSWAVTITGSADLNDLGGIIFADAIKVQNAAFEICEGPAVPLTDVNCGPANTECTTATGCFIEFTADQSLVQSCACEFSEVVVCGINNVLTTTFTPGFGCSAIEEAYTSTGVCDFCNPGYVADSITCDINRSEGDGLTGTGIVTFTSTNPGCCIQTGLVSDCQAPALDNNELICSQGYWLSEYNDVSSTRKNAGTNTFSNETISLDELSASSTLVGGGTVRQIQPIVFDIDDDGVTETITFTNTGGTGVLTVYDPELNVEQIIDVGATIVGDAGLFEFDARQGFSDDYKAGTNGAGIAVMVDSGSNEMKLYLSESGLLALKVTIPLSSSGAASVFCDRDFCYTVEDGDTLIQVDVDALSISGTHSFPGSSSGSDVNWRNLPAKVADFSGNIIVAKGLDAGGDVAIFACNVDTSSCVKQEIVGFGPIATVDPENVTEVYVGPKQTFDFGVTFHSPVYWSTHFEDEVFNHVAFVKHDSSPTFAFLDVYEVSKLSADAACVIAPAAAECPADGVFFASQWNPAASVVDASITLNFDYTGLEANSFSAIGSVGGTGDPQEFTSSTIDVGGTNNVVAMTICSSEVCYTASGVEDLSNYGNRDWTFSDMYVSEAGGPWTQIANNPDLVQHNATNSQFGQTCSWSDGIMGWGSMDGRLFMLRTGLIEVGAGLSPGAATCIGTSPSRWSNWALDEFEIGSGWTNVASGGSTFFDTDGSWPAGGDDFMGTSMGRKMLCDSQRCLHFMTDETGHQSVLEIKTHGILPTTVTLDSPGGDVIGFDVSQADEKVLTGFAQTADAKYYALRDTTSTGTGFVIRYDSSTPGVGDLMGAVLPYAVTVQGLAADPAEFDDVYFAVIPGTLGAGTASNPFCPFAGNGTSIPAAFNGDIEVIEPTNIAAVPGSFADLRVGLGVRNGFTDCEFKIFKIDNGVNGLFYSEDVRRWSNPVISGHHVGFGPGPTGVPDFGLVLAPGRYWSIGDFDTNGEYYATYLNSLCLGDDGSCLSTQGAYTVSCCPSFTFNPGDTNQAWPNSVGVSVVYEVISENGVYHPFKAEFDDVSSRDTLRALVTPSLGSPTLCDDRVMNDDGTDSGCKPVDSHRMADLSNVYGQHVKPYHEVDSLVAWGYARGSRVTIGHKALNSPLYALIGVGSLLSQAFTDVGCYVASISGGISKVAGSILPIGDCSAQLLSADVDRDGVDEIILSEGIFEFATAEELVSLNQPQSSGFGIVDLTSDSFLDLVFLTGTTIRHIISVADLNIQFSEALSVSSLLCTFDGSTATAQFLGVGTQNPGSLKFSGEMFEEGNAVAVQTVGAQDSATLLFTPTSTGVHEINGFVLDTVTGESVGTTCVFTVETLAVDLVIFSDVASELSCSIAPAGEFNYDNSVQAYDWFIDRNGREPQLDGAKAIFNKQDIRMLYGLSCEDPQMSATIRIKPTASTNFKFQIQAEDWFSLSSTDVTWTVENIGGIWVFGDQLWVWTSTEADAVKVFDGLLTTRYYDISMEFERDSSTYKVLIDGEIISIVNNWNGVFKGKYVAVIVKSLDGTSYVDYVRTEGLTGTVTEILLPGQGSAAGAAGAAYGLSNCRSELNDSDFRNFTEVPVGNLSRENINAYCSEFGETFKGSKICLFEHLRDAVRINPDCYQEAFTYCVEETFPKTAGFQDSNQFTEANQRTEQGVDLNGAAVCSIALQTQAAGSSLLSPLWNLLWKGTLNNPIFAMVLVFMLFVGIAIWAKTR